MHYKLYELGPITIYSYGFFIAVGILVAIMVGDYRAKKKGLNGDIIYGLGFWCMIGGFLGAKIFYILTELKNIINDPSLLLDFANGFVVYGGIIFGILVGYIYSRIKKVKFIKYFDIVMPSISIAQGFGRIGCFMAGCCYGRETHSHIGIMLNDSPFAPHNVKLIPTQLFSSLGDFLLAAILIIYAKKKRKDGKVASLYLILYSVGRFIIEIFRNDERGTVGVFSTSQFISIGTLIVGVALFIYFAKRKSKDETDDETVCG